jgi:hypothetical protein
MIPSTNLLNTVSALGYDLGRFIFFGFCCSIFGFYVSLFFKFLCYCAKGVKKICYVLRNKFLSKRS